MDTELIECEIVFPENPAIRFGLHQGSAVYLKASIDKLVQRLTEFFEGRAGQETQPTGIDPEYRYAALPHLAYRFENGAVSTDADECIELSRAELHIIQNPIWPHPTYLSETLCIVNRLEVVIQQFQNSFQFGPICFKSQSSVYSYPHGLNVLGDM